MPYDIDTIIRTITQHTKKKEERRRKKKEGERRKKKEERRVSHLCQSTECECQCPFQA